MNWLSSSLVRYSAALHGKLGSTTVSCGSTALSKTAPAEVLVAVIRTHHRMHLASIAFCSEALLRDMALLHYRSQDILACTFSKAHGWAFVGLGGGRLLDGGSPPGRHGHRCRDCYMPHPEEPFRPARRWSTSGLCRHTRGRHSSEVTPAPPQGWTSEQDQSDTYHLSETGLIATLAVVYGLTSSPHVQTARQSGSPPLPSPPHDRKKAKVGGAHSIRAQEHRPPREQGHTS